MSAKYILDDAGNPVECDDLMTWARWFETADRTVRRTELGDVHVSTVFLGIDHRLCLNPGPPLVFETMIFGGPHDDYQRRYATQAEALDGHRRAVQVATAADERPQKGRGK